MKLPNKFVLYYFIITLEVDDQFVLAVISQLSLLIHKMKLHQVVETELN